MELWIRSQGKDILVKCEKIGILNRNETDYVKNMFKTMEINPIELQIMIVANDCINLGTYKTKERALEILDEIQKILKPQLIIKDRGKIIGSFEDNIIREGATYELKEFSTYVYEMPSK